MSNNLKMKEDHRMLTWKMRPDLVKILNALLKV
jgi:hypothetical protein